MKRLSFFLIALTISNFSLGIGLTGQKHIPGTTGDPDSYASIVLAIADLNTAGVGAGGVTFNVAANYTESITTPLLITATGTSLATIIFRKDPATAGSNPIVTRTDGGNLNTSVLGAQGDAVIIIEGCDYLTFDAIDVVATNQGIEYGYYLRKVSATDGCKNSTVRNANITMTKGGSNFVVGIYSSNNIPSSGVGSVGGVVVTSTGGRNENISITGNRIMNVFAGILVRGYNHTSTPYDFLDQNNVVGADGEGNTIMNYGGNAASTTYGIYLIYQTSPTVSYNTIDNAGGGGTNATAILYGIFNSNSNAGGNMVFRNNIITLSQGSVSLANCIQVAPTGTSVTISSNSFSYNAFASTTTSYLINCSNATNNVTIDGNYTNGSIIKSGAGQFECISNGGASTGGTATISHNTFANITLSGASPFYGIREAGSSSIVQMISDNIFSNISGSSSSMYGIYQSHGAAGSEVHGNMITNWNGSGIIYGIVLGFNTAPVSMNAYDNKINGLHTSGLSVFGIQNVLGTATNIYNNRICDLSSTNINANVYGINLTGGNTTNVYNNYMTGLQSNNADGLVPLSGIYVSGGTNANVFFNTVNLYAVSSGVNFGTAAIYASAATNLDMRNNILINKSSHNGSGHTVVYWRSGINLSTYLIGSDANDFYTWTTDPACLIFYDGVNSDQTMAAYKFRVGPTRDAHSFSEDPPFEEALPACNPHMRTTIATQCESGGVQVTVPIDISSDIEGDARSVTPDVGADEFNGITPFPPMISGTILNPEGIPPLPQDLYIVASPHCNPAVTQTTANGGIIYEILGGVGRYRIFDFPGSPAQIGDIVDVTFFDGVNFRSLQVTITGGFPVVANITIVANMFVTMQKTDWYTIAIPPNHTLRIHWNNVQWPYDGTGGCGNTDVQQWNGVSWYLPPYSPWNFNPDSTIREITNTSSTSYIFKRFHCDDGYGFTLDFTIVPSTGSTSSGNPQDFAVLNLGGRDGFACEFGNIIAVDYTFAYQTGALVYDFPQRMGSDGVQNLTIEFESYDNIFWGDMDLMIDLVNVTHAGTLELYIPDATVPYTYAAISPGDPVVHFHPGGILTRGTHTMMLSATGGLSMGIDCFNYTSVVPAPVLPTVTTTPVTNITTYSAEGGGNVTSDGGAFVSARGVCWATHPGPTILDSYSAAGNGTGPFVSMIAPLLPSSMYFVRAYAINSVGTAYGNELIFMTLPMENIITGTVVDSVGVSPPPEFMYIVAHTRCNPNDSLSTYSGGISYSVGGGGAATYVVHCTSFINPPSPGEQVFISFYNTATGEFETEMVQMELSGGTTVYNPVIRLTRHVHLPFKTASIRVMIPAHKTLQLHYTFVNGCGNTDVMEWNSLRWVKFRQWNWNHYCTWRYIENNTNKPKVYVIHNDNGNIWFDMMFNCPVNPGTTPSNSSEFALVNFGWRDRPYNTCEFGNIIAPAYLFFDFEGAYLDQFPLRLGIDGVQSLVIQFDSYNNIFWNEMTLMIDLMNITQPGTLALYIPDATIPFTTAVISPLDTACFFYPGGILVPGTHTMTLSVSGGLSVGIDALNFTSAVPIPNLPVVTTAPVTSISWYSATCGGNVSSDGGASVTARGVCWSTLPNPTILDSHTTDGSGIGSFTSLVTPLNPLTSYHVRAYATNLTGTAYGESIEFSTRSFVPDYRTVQDSTIGPGESECYDAVYTIFVAGDNTFYYVEPTGSATFVSTGNIRFLPHTRIKYGGYMRGYIDPDGNYCPPTDVPSGTVSTVSEIAAGFDHPEFKIYPNPTSGSLTLEQTGEKIFSEVSIKIYGLHGETVYSSVMIGNRKHRFDFSGIPDGMYFIRIVTDGYSETKKLIKMR